MSDVAFELLSQGYTHVRGRCGACELVVTVTFAEAAKRLNCIAWCMTIEQMNGLACTDCLDRPALLDVKPIRRARTPRCG